MVKAVLAQADGAESALYMSAEAAAATLNVSIATLYTYVSRKNLRVYKPIGSRVSRYLRSDIEQMKSGMSLHAGRDGPSGLTASTAVTLMTDGGSYYRGTSAIALANHASLEATARLLWATGDDDPFDQPAPAVPETWNALFDATAGFSPADRLIMLLPALEVANLRAHDLSQPGFWRSGVDIMRWAAAIAMNQRTPSRAPTHQVIGTVTQCGETLADMVRRVLVLSADQAFEPATYAVRATANTGATPYRCVITGLAAASGKRLPSVRTGSFARFINEIDAATDPTEPVKVRVRESDDLPGFGYSPSDEPDPRAVALWAALQESLADDGRFRHFAAAVGLAMDLTALHPDFAFLAAWVSLRVGNDPRVSLVRLGRLVGWLAHALEQQQEKPLIRWKVNYTGRLPS